MRLLRLAVRNFRGLDECDVTFDEAGITVVEGPNEAGKSSLAEALDLLLDFQDSSKAQPVRDVQPVHRDEGAEVSAEIQAGPYRFTFEKRFHKRPQTTLTVTAPRHESHTGREAHERAVAILGETVDLALWKALRIAQGEGRDSPTLTGDSLVAALERAGGGAAEQNDAESLYAAAEAEAAQYVGKSGKPLKTVTDLDEAVSRADVQVAELADVVRSSEQAVERLEALARQRMDHEARRPELATRVETCAREKAALDERKRELDTLTAAEAEARATAERADRDVQARADLVQRVAQAAAELAEIDGARTAAAPELAAAQRRLTSAESAATAARDTAELAERLLRRRTADREFRRHEIEAAQFRERLERLDRARARRTSAESTLARARVDDAALGAIRAAHTTATQARARATAEAAVVRVEALGELWVRMGDEARNLAAGDHVEQVVEDAQTIEIGDVARVVVRSGAGGDARRARDEADAALTALLDNAGVAAFDEAITSHRERARAQDELARANEDEAEALRDLAETELRHLLARRDERVAAYADERARDTAAPPLAPDFAASKDLLSEAEEVREARVDEQRAADRERAAAQTAIEELRRSDAAQETTRSERTGELRAHERSLADARAHADDDTLAAARQTATGRAEHAAERAADARGALERASPELVDSALAGAREALRSAETRSREIDTEMARLRERVDLLGAQGVGERLAQSEAARDRACYRADAAKRRMAAAVLLATTLRTHRDEARRAYRAPLAQRIDELGRYVFGDDFAVTLDEDLTVAARTLHGRTVPFRSLSVGAREQLALITRIAAAKLVAPDGGVPLVLDDALGHSDPDRLARMGAVLSRAGKDVQIVLLTCRPERADQIAGARLVRLG